MLTKSQISYKREPAANYRCRHHPELDIDTICFSQACRQKGEQIMCSYCGQQQPHLFHTHQQYPIYKTSPGFRLINLQGQFLNLTEIGKQRLAIKESAASLKLFLAQSIDEMVNEYQKRSQCFADFLKKNAIFKVCSKIRHNFGDHIDCCVEMVNGLKDLQDSQTQPKNTHQFIRRKMRGESQILISKIEHIRIGLNNLLSTFLDVNKVPQKNGHQRDSNRLDKESENSFQRLFQQQNNKKVTISIEQSIVNASSLSEANHEQINLCDRESNPEQNLLSKNSINRNMLLEEAENPPSLQASLINELLDFDRSQTNGKGQGKDTIQSQSKLKSYVGIDFQISNKAIIWDANHQLIENLPQYSNIRRIKHLIIQDKSLANQGNFENLEKIIKNMPSLVGIHFNCESELSENILKFKQLKYLSLFPSYSFIESIDRLKHFSFVQRTMLDYIPQQFLRKFNKNKGFKNAYITYQDDQINASAEEVNFVQNQSQVYWTFNKKMEEKLSNANNLLILVFSNILIGRDVSFKRVFSKQSNLNTLVFDDCQANMNTIISYFKYLRINQLTHLQISGDNLDRKIHLRYQSVNEIFSHSFIKTLILVNVEMKPENKHHRKTVLRLLKKLPYLTHLNLFDSWPVFPDLIHSFHQNCYQNLTYLNIGCSQVKLKHSRYLKTIVKRFPKLQSLCLDYTQISEPQLSNLLKDKNFLQYLSIQNLNGETIHYYRERKTGTKNYGLITPNFFENLPIKNLKYVNIYNCKYFANYLWEGFDKLQCIRVNQSQLTEQTIKKLSKKGIRVNIEKNNQFIAAHSQINSTIEIQSSNESNDPDIQKNQPQDQDEIGPTESSLLINEKKNIKRMASEVILINNRSQSKCSTMKKLQKSHHFNKQRESYMQIQGV